VAFLNPRNVWPELPYEILRPTLETLQLCAQVAGKTCLAKTPWVNHSWHVTVYVSARGLTTGLIPYGALALELEFDLISHVLFVRATDGGPRSDSPCATERRRVFWKQLRNLGSRSRSMSTRMNWQIRRRSRWTRPRKSMTATLRSASGSPSFNATASLTSSAPAL
jgi:Family of unknown function (DUF5996)